MKKNKVTEKKQLSPAQLHALTNTEHTGTAMLQVGQQMLLATEEILKKEFGFTPEQLTHYEKEMGEMMEALGYLEERGLSVQTIDFMHRVGEIAGHITAIRKQRLAQTQSNLILPTNEEIKKIGN